jgi:glycine betaine/choline ABC-type transport system substrate-binding protein
VYRPDTAARVPALTEVLRLLEGGIDEGTMRRLNRQVDDEGRAARDVVKEFLSRE